jgi:hypothetical protein
MAAPFRLHPRPDLEVVALLERTLAAARQGHVRSIAINTCNPLNESESLFAGDLSQVRCNALVGSLVRSTIELSSLK